jgi:hypothetical protein
MAHSLTSQRSQHHHLFQELVPFGLRQLATAFSVEGWLRASLLALSFCAANRGITGPSAAGQRVWPQQAAPLKIGRL